MTKKTFTKIRKWAEEMGYTVEDKNLVSWKPRVIVRANENIYFEAEINESTMYTSVRGGRKGNPAGLYITTHEKDNYRSYSWHQPSQRVAIEFMENRIEETNERFAQ